MQHALRQVKAVGILAPADGAAGKIGQIARKAHRPELEHGLDQDLRPGFSAQHIQAVQKQRQKLRVRRVLL